MTNSCREVNKTGNVRVT